VTLALIIAAIAAGGGIVQGSVQGLLTSRAATINARQEAAWAMIDLCDRVLKNLAEMAQAANEYGLNLADDSFLSNWEVRQPFIHRILTAHGTTKAAVGGLPLDSPARRPLEEAMRVCTALPSIGERRDILASWKAENHYIADAFDAVGRERAHQLALLQVAGRPWWVRWGVQRAGKPTLPPSGGPASSA